jgi:hypothetical protein
VNPHSVGNVNYVHETTVFLRIPKYALAQIEVRRKMPGVDQEPMVLLKSALTGGKNEATGSPYDG